MSDEEKKAIEYLKHHIIPVYGKKGQIEYFLNDTILNLIEKQSKEIEELNKENTRQHELICNIHKHWKDKIKAKIEPVLKQLDTKMKEEYNKYGNSREYQDMVDAYNFLQSLLEKE